MGMDERPVVVEQPLLLLADLARQAAVAALDEGGVAEVADVRAKAPAERRPEDAHHVGVVVDERRLVVADGPFLEVLRQELQQDRVRLGYVLAAVDVHPLGPVVTLPEAAVAAAPRGLQSVLGRPGWNGQRDDAIPYPVQEPYLLCFRGGYRDFGDVDPPPLGTDLAAGQGRLLAGGTGCAVVGQVAAYLSRPATDAGVRLGTLT
ncbi:hypothetical protein VTK73DRAFT_740 [Phialemonium thermophilum]|uniref:Uncharacterized protein n=1 Tax=Phialemonium thermophilum TaxID=223376 RepID=A0ABR3VUC7_9PEZI